MVFVDIIFVLGLLAITITGLVSFFRSECVFAIIAKRLQRITMGIMSNRSHGSTDETSPATSVSVFVSFGVKRVKIKCYWATNKQKAIT